MSKSISAIKRQRAAEQLKDFPPSPEVLKTLDSLLVDNSKQIRKLAIKSLLSYGTSNLEVIKSIEKATKNRDPQVRDMAHLCLSEKKSEKSKKYFLQQLQMKLTQERITNKD